MPDRPHDPAKVAEKRTLIYRMHVDEGKSTDAIAAELGMGRGDVYRNIVYAAKEVPVAEREVIRTIAHQRYESLYRGLRRVLNEEDLTPAEYAAVSKVTKEVVDKTVVLFGAALPQKVIVETPSTDPVDVEFAEVVREAKEQEIRDRMEIFAAGRKARGVSDDAERDDGTAA